MIEMSKDLKGLAVGLWVTPPAHLVKDAEGIEREYGRIRDAGMNMVWGFWNYGDKLGEVLDACARLGVDYIVPLPVSGSSEVDLEAEMNKCLGIVEDYKDHPAVSGFNMIDEPSAAIFGKLADIRSRVDAVLPEGKFALANLFPNYASAEQLGVKTYREHVEQYMSQVKPKVLSFDHYPLSTSAKNDNHRSFIENLLEIRAASLKYNVPFWGFIQAIGFNGRREPNYSEIRWLNNMHILFGAKGYSYFLYAAVGEDGGAENISTAALLWDGSTTPLYDMIKSINAEFSAFDRAFIQFAQGGFIPVNMKSAVLKAFGGDGLLKDNYGHLNNIATDGVMLNGCFDFAGQKGVYLFNWDMAAPMTASLTFDGEETAYELWGKGGMETSGTGAGLEVALEAGEGKFLVFAK